MVAERRDPHRFLRAAVRTLIFGGKFIILVPILILIITQWQLLTPQAVLLVILIALQLL